MMAMQVDGEFDNDVLIETAPVSQTVPEGTSIDAPGIVRELKRHPAQLPPVQDNAGFDLQVRNVVPEERIAITVAACIVCGCGHARPTFRIEGMQQRVVTCTECGLASMHPRPSVRQIESFYPPDYYGTSGEKFEPLVEAMVKLVGARHAQSLIRGLPRGARVLDVGCGRGVLLGALADKGCEAHGFEISPTAAEGADSRASIRIASDLAQADYPTDYFDEVILWHVLEHLPNPREVLTEIRRILRPGGRLAVSVPNLSSVQARWAGPAWFHLDLPRHLYHFPLSCLKRLLDECGFDCGEKHHFSLRQNPFGWVQSFLNRNAASPRNGLYRMLKRSAQDKQGLFTRSQRLGMRAAYWLGMPIAIVASLFAALLGRGASVCVMANSRSGENARERCHAADVLETFAESHPECLPH